MGETSRFVSGLSAESVEGKSRSLTASPAKSAGLGSDDKFREAGGVGATQPPRLVAWGEVKPVGIIVRSRDQRKEPA